MLRFPTKKSLNVVLCLTKCYHMGPIQSLKATVSIRSHSINTIFSPHGRKSYRFGTTLGSTVLLRRKPTFLLLVTVEYITQYVTCSNNDSNIFGVSLIFQKLQKRLEFKTKSGLLLHFYIPIQPVRLIVWNVSCVCFERTGP